MVTARSSVLVTALPSPGKCFAVAATPPPWRAETNTAASEPTSVVSLPNERVPRKLRGVEIVSATGARSTQTWAWRSAAAASTACRRTSASVLIAAAERVGGAHGSRRTEPPS